MISEEILSILVCPKTKERLILAKDSEVKKINDEITKNKVVNMEGRILKNAMDGFLITENGALAYPVQDGIPVLLIEEGIPLSELGIQ